MVVSEPAKPRSRGPRKTDASPEPANSPRAVARIVTVLTLVANNPSGCTLSFLAREMDVPKSSLFNILRGLVGGGYLTVTKGVHRLGPESYRLAASISRSNSLTDIARAVLQRLRDQTGETAIIGLLTPDLQVAYVDQALSQHSIRAQIFIGEHRPAFSSAGGRAILAFLPPERIDTYFDTIALTRTTPTTETRKAPLLKILAGVKKDGYAVTDGEAEQDLAGVAAPIFDQAGNAVASVIISGPSERLRGRLKDCADLVKKAGAELSRLKGYRPPASRSV